jgi:hypothetical protein
MAGRIYLSRSDDVFTPLLRRFTDEGARGTRELQAMHDRVTSRHRSGFWARPDAIEHTSEAITKIVEDDYAPLPDYQPLRDALDRCQRELLALETQIFDPIAVDLSQPLSMRNRVDLNARLRKQDEFLQHEDGICEMLAVAIAQFTGATVRSLRPLSSSGLGVPLIAAVGDPAALLDTVISIFFKPEHFKAGVFAALTERLYENMCSVSGVTPQAEPGETLVWPSAAKKPAAQLVEAYLRDTPLASLFEAQVFPFVIPITRRLEHTAIIAGSGWGKTQLLQTIVTDDLQQSDPPSIIVIDSTNRMVERIQNLQLFNDRLKDRILIIDPEGLPAPALNMFDLTTPRMIGYSADMRERVQSDIIALFNYVFSSIQNPLTDPMRTAFAYVVRLLITVPDATITTLRKLLEEHPKGGYEASAFKESIDKLDPTARDFFRVQFFTDRVKATRDSILQRLSSVISVPAFERMFSTVNKIDFFDEMQRGTCILVNTSEAMLKDASPLFGRYIIARVMAAAFERAALPDPERKPTFLIVDEAAPYFDDQFEKLLTRVRQFKLGVVIAFQHLEQASEKLRSAIASNTSVKFAGGLGFSDSRWLSRDMRTTPEKLLALRQDDAEPPQYTNYACYVRGTDAAVTVNLPFYALEHVPAMSRAEHAALIERNKPRTAYVPSATQPAASVAPEPPPSTSAPLIGDAGAASSQPHSGELDTVSEPPPQSRGDPGEPSDKWEA